jgi:hypothetical protein
VPVSFRAASSGTGSSPVTVTFPTGTVAGDLVVINLGVDATTTYVTPSGWTKIGSTQIGVNNVRAGAAFWRVIDGTEGGAVAVTSSGTNFMWWMAMTAQGGGAPLTVTSSAFSKTANYTNSMVASAITTSYANALLFSIFSALSISGGGLYSPPAGETEALEANNIAGNYETQAAAGSTGSKTESYSGSPGAEATMLLVAIEHVPTNTSTTCTTGALSITGNAAGLPVARKTTAVTGALVLSGAAAGLSVARKTTAAPGALAIAGPAVGMPVARKTTAAAGALAISGSAAGMPVGRRTVAVPGALVIAGSAVAMPVARRLAAVTGALVISGSAVGMPVNRRTIAVAGALSIAGSAARLSVARRLLAQTGALVITGYDVAIVVNPGGVKFWTVPLSFQAISIPVTLSAINVPVTMRAITVPVNLRGVPVPVILQEEV